MRKTTLLMAVGLVMALAAPALARRVVNESHSEYQIQAWMGSEDGSTNGGAWAIQGSNGEALGIDFNANYDCEGADGDDLAWENVNGEANLEEFEVSPTKGNAKYTFGYATGSFAYGSYDWEECDGDQGSFDLTSERLTLDADGTGGSLVKTSGSNTWHIPSETNNHRNEKGTLRLADVFVFIPGGIVDWHGEGSIGQHSWSEHSNE